MTLYTNILNGILSIPFREKVRLVTNTNVFFYT